MAWCSRKLASLPRLVWDPDLLLLVRVQILLLLLDVAVGCVGLLPVWRLVQRRFRRRVDSSHGSAAEIAGLRRVVVRAARSHVFRMNCLPRALALAWLLAEKGIAAELRLGARLDAGTMRAHAWIEHAGQPLDVAAERQNGFRPLAGRRFVLGTRRVSRAPGSLIGGNA
jgi:hypothetical protein